MTTVAARDVYVTWSGELSQWPDYVRKVRLQFEKTKESRRRMLGPELASRLTDKAWQAIYDIDHKRLASPSGAKYLLTFLRDKLCRAPVPDAGARLEDLLIRLRRSPGTPFAQWAHEVRESYRHLQRALLRARREGGLRSEPKKTKDGEVGSSKASRKSPSEPEVRAESRAPISPGSRSVRSMTVQPASNPTSPQNQEVENQEAEEPEGGDAAWEDEWYGYWTPQQWREWNSWWTQDSDSQSWDGGFEEEDEDADVPWDELEVDEAEVLPEEVLGWILLRRAGLPTSSRLSVQASVGNSLRFDAIERALRDQEEELLAAERRPFDRRHGGPQRRTYWVKNWGLMDYEPDQDDLPIHWVGERLPDEVYHVDPEVGHEYDDSGWNSTSWEDDPWQIGTAWWSQDWTSSSPEVEFSPEEVTQMEEAFAAYEDKVRTFVQARQVMKNKATNRGFFPTVKGKFGGKGKGKSKGKNKNPAPVLAAASSSTGKQRPGQPEYTGCFICGAKDHSFLQCPKRKGKGQAHFSSEVFYVETVPFEFEAAVPEHEVVCVPNFNLCEDVFMAFDEETEEVHTWNASAVGERCHAVLDSGATETVASLTALTEIMSKRQGRYGPEDFTVFEDVHKTFRFGNGKTLRASSYVEIPQTIGGKLTMLGVHTLDTDDQYVPLLIGMKTLERLHAVVDFGQKVAKFLEVSDNMVRLQQCQRTSHCLLDLSSDWIDESFDEVYKELLQRGLHVGSHVSESLVVAEAEVQCPLDSWPSCATVFPPSSLAVENQLENQPDNHPACLEAQAHEVGDPLSPKSSVVPPSHGNEQGVLGMQHDGIGLQGQVQGEESSSAGRGDLRLLEERRAGCEGPSLQGRTLCREGTYPCPNGAWQPQRKERMGAVANMPNLSPALGVHPSVWRTRPLQVGWTIGGRCQEPTCGEEQRDCREPEGVVHGECGFGRCRTKPPPAPGEDSEAEGGLEPESQWSDNYYNNQEDGQASRADDPGRVGGQSRLRGVMEDGEGGRVMMSTPESVKLLIADSIESTTTAMQVAEEEFNAVTGDSSLPCLFGSEPQQQLKLLEMCCPPNSALSSMVEQFGGRAARITEKNMNLTTASGFEQALSFLRKERPEWVWVSFPCGATSPIQNFNELDEWGKAQSMERKRKSRRLVRRGLRLLREHVLEHGGHFAWEWPRHNEAWKWREVQEFLKEVHEKVGIYKTLLDGCQVGVEDGNGLPVKKPWQIYTTDRDMAATLNIQCPGHHKHGECLGGQVAKKSGFYPPKMVRLISRQMFKPRVALEVDGEIFGAKEVQEESMPEGLTPTDWKRIKEVVHRLHVRAGHPSRDALERSLKSRGAHPFVIAAARHLHCDDCAETKKPVPGARSSFQRADTIWHTLQMDCAQFHVGKQIVHVLMLVDEASTFLVPHLLCIVPDDVHENAKGEQVVLAIQESWIRFFGHPSMIRLDPEGAFRSRALEEFCASRDIELEPCAAEAHYQIGVVERSIGTIRKSLEKFLRSHADEPWSAILSMCSAHNEMARIGGFSPNQWAFGRSFSLDEKLHEGKRVGVPFFNTQKDPVESLHQTLSMKLKAEDMYRKTLAQEVINRAWNSKSKKSSFFVPGTLCYYKRYKPPSTSTVSHADVDVSRRNIARWFGPARVLATESRIENGTGRPSHIVWIVAGGRLKRVAPEQLRYASEREKLLEEVGEPHLYPWTFHRMMQQVEKGQYDSYEDITEAPHKPTVKRARSAALEDRNTSSRTLRASSTRARSRSREPKETTRPQKTPSRAAEDPSSSDVRPVGRSRTPMGASGQLALLDAGEGTASASNRIGAPESGVVFQPEAPTPTPVSRSTPSQPGYVDPLRILNDPSFSSHGGTSSTSWTGELKSNPLFLEARRRHEAADRPLHVIQQENQVNFSESPAFMCDTLEDTTGDVDLPGLMVMMSIDMPENAAQMKRFKRDPETWIGQKLKKSPEVHLSKMSTEKQAEFRDAKQMEVSQWIQAAACKALEKGQIAPRGRTMSMRWVLTFKSTGAAKARIVIVGYTDPDIEHLDRTSPTMSRRTRQLMGTMAAVRMWQQWKCDAKSAFLQTSWNSEEARGVFARPVDELADAMGVPRGSIIQVVKSCYGLVNAPHQWYLEVSSRIVSLGGEVLVTEPCCWRIRDPETQEVVGLIASHVDDFYMIGDQDNEAWTRFMHRFRAAYRWSPWEVDSFEHCGVSLNQTSNMEILLDHSKFCTNIQQIELEGDKSKRPVTEGEREQLRAVLGAVQWRAMQSGPQHCAKLSQLQSRIVTADTQVIADVNKLVREVYSQRELAPRSQNLGCDPSEVEFICWSDAALANRCDGGSTGGYIVGATSPAMRKGERAKMNVVSWRTFKLRRVARSSLSAEVQAFSEGEEELMFCRLEWSEMLGHKIDLKRPEDAYNHVRGIMVTDAKSLYDAIQKGAINTSGLGLSEKYSAIELLSILERLKRGNVETRWVDSFSQLADSLTKHQVNAPLLKVLITGVWTLVYDPKFVSAKRKLQESKARDFGACELNHVVPSNLAASML